jgi:pyruvate/2-oxoglutarate dehydrogenase complex dihydrolipoamide dehydrogenase (E3) component
MPDIAKYDAIILGSGEAGKYLAWHLASTGLRTAMVERRYIGGACPNIACLPSKNVIHTAKVATYVKDSESYGLPASSAKVSMSAVIARKRSMVDELVAMHLSKYANSGVDLIQGNGRFVGDRTLEVILHDGSIQILRGERVFINTGSRARIEGIPGFSEADPLTHVEALELDQLPEHLLILGGGAVGLEFAQAMRRLGSKVTLVIRESKLLNRDDPDVSQGVSDLFKEEGIEVVSNATVSQVSGKSGVQVVLHLTQNGEEVFLEGTHLLAATGRTPNTDGLGLELAGVALTSDGSVKVNERLETTAPHVWALGDCAGSPHLTHISYDDFRVVRDNLAGGHHVTAGRQIPSCLFTDPELARVGLSEMEARQMGILYRLAKIPMSAIPRTRTTNETRGFLKALINADNDQILGFTGFGIGSGELMATVQLAMRAGIPYQVVRDQIIAHPTLSEGLVFLFTAVPPMQANSSR